MKDIQATAKFLSKHHKLAVEAMQEHVTHLYLVRRVLQELRRQLGPKGFKQWMRLHCPELTWEDVTFILNRPEQADINPIHLNEIIEEGNN